jgi:hypothetical protein
MHIQRIDRQLSSVLMSACSILYIINKHAAAAANCWKRPRTAMQRIGGGGQKF